MMPNMKLMSEHLQLSLKLVSEHPQLDIKLRMQLVNEHIKLRLQLVNEHIKLDIKLKLTLINEHMKMRRKGKLVKQLAEQLVTKEMQLVKKETRLSFDGFTPLPPQSKYGTNVLFFGNDTSVVPPSSKLSSAGATPLQIRKRIWALGMFGGLTTTMV